MRSEKCKLARGPTLHTSHFSLLTLHSSPRQPVTPSPCHPVSPLTPSPCSQRTIITVGAPLMPLLPGTPVLPIFWTLPIVRPMSSLGESRDPRDPKYDWGGHETRTLSVLRHGRLSHHERLHHGAGLPSARRPVRMPARDLRLRAARLPALRATGTGGGRSRPADRRDHLPVLHAPRPEGFLPADSLVRRAVTGPSSVHVRA